MKKMNKKAFTLIELLIVIAIIGILFIVLVSKVDFATDKAKATGVQTDFRSFQMAFEQVAKENAGFTTFGWDCGDLNADGVRNSYDVGDKACGTQGCTECLEHDGKKGPHEVWTGRKEYTEDWTGVWTLVKPNAADKTKYDEKAIFALESAINKNLDPKLHITIATDGKITMANQARDPWKNEYEGYLMCNSEVNGQQVANKDSDKVDSVITEVNGKAKATGDELDRGAIVIYSKGANGNLGSMAKVEGGVVTVTVSTISADAGDVDNNVAGKDDYSFSTIYTFKNGYGEVISATTGFSSNQ